MTTPTSKYNVKRIAHEIQEMLPIYKSISVEYEETRAIITIIQSPSEENTITVEFSIKEGYPFTPPIITLTPTPTTNPTHQKRIPYMTWLKTSSRRVHQALKTLTKTDCLCCSTILCPNRWSPANTLKDILQEIETTQNVKQKIKYILATKDIGKKFNLPEVIETYISGFC
jgi:ubiquitin-protein ligase